MSFFGARTERFLRGGRINSGAQSILERSFDASIFARVEGQKGSAAATPEASGQDAKEVFQRAELVVHEDAERLENAADGIGGLVFA